MCRFLIYKGREMFMSDLITKSEQSLIRQSFKARERAEPLNGDGFGVGWYMPEIDPTPCVFNDLRPAWANRNLHRLAEKVRSTCLFAHVRAASGGMSVSEANCHPFQYEQFLWMHNGGVAEFRKIRRRLREALDDEYYDLIQGTTDSEHVFALFLNKLSSHMEDYSAEVLADTMAATIRQLNEWTEDAGVSGLSRYNFAVTDGHNVVATRYVSDPASEPHSLYYASGEAFEAVEGSYRMRPAQRQPKAAIIASEPLTTERSDWTPVPANHLVMVTPELHLRVQPVS
jgi:ergothioneine biosynthesis protein EgtC